MFFPESEDNELFETPPPDRATVVLVVVRGDVVEVVARGVVVVVVFRGDDVDVVVFVVLVLVDDFGTDVVLDEPDPPDCDFCESAMLKALRMLPREYVTFLYGFVSLVVATHTLTLSRVDVDDNSDSSTRDLCFVSCSLSSSSCIF